MLTGIRDFLARLAGSKLVSYAGLSLSIIGTLCVTNRADVIDAFGQHGVKWCAFLALAGTFVTLFGQGVASRRPPERDSGMPPRVP